MSFTSSEATTQLLLEARNIRMCFKRSVSNTKGADRQVPRGFEACKPFAASTRTAIHM